MPDTQVTKNQSARAKPLFVSFFEWFGELGIFSGRLVHGAFSPPYEVREFVRQLDAVGSLSLPLVWQSPEPPPEWCYLSRRATV